MSAFDGAQPARRLPSDNDTKPTVGIVRGLPNAYEVNAYGYTYSTNPLGGWIRGQIVRSAEIPFVMPPPVPIYDPDPGPPQDWRP